MENEFQNIKNLAGSISGRTSAKIRSVWPEIMQAREHGHTLKTIWKALKRDGIGISYSTFRWYFARMRVKSRVGEGRATAEGYGENGSKSSAATGRSDPAANIREQRAKRVVFEHDPLGGTKKGLTS